MVVEATVDTEGQLDKIIKEFQLKFHAWTGNVAKLSAPWTREAEQYLRDKDFVVIGSIEKDPSVIGLADGIIVELYR